MKENAMRHPRRTHWATWTLVGVGVLMLLGTCGAGDDDETSDTPTTEQSSSTTEATTTTLAAEGPEEWIAVVRDLNERYFELLQNPDPDRLAEIYADTCTCWQQTHDTIQLLADDGEHIEGQPVAVAFVKLEQDDPTTGAVDLTVKEVMAEPWKRVDEDGTVVQELPADPDGNCSALTLYPDGANGGYRIHSLVSPTGCPLGS